MKDSTISFIAIMFLVLLCVFNVYMNLYNDHNISEIEKRTEKLEQASQPRLDTLYINQKDSTFIISWYRF